MIKLFKIP